MRGGQESTPDQGAGPAPLQDRVAALAATWRFDVDAHHELHGAEGNPVTRAACAAHRDALLMHAAALDLLLEPLPDEAGTPNPRGEQPRAVAAWQVWAAANRWDPDDRANTHRGAFMAGFVAGLIARGTVTTDELEVVAQAIDPTPWLPQFAPDAWSIEVIPGREGRAHVERSRAVARQKARRALAVLGIGEREPWQGLRP